MGSEREDGPDEMVTLVLRGYPPTTRTAIDQTGHSDSPPIPDRIMDDSEIAAETATTEEAFDTALQKLVQAAYANGVNIEGGWKCRTTTTDPDWEIMILEVTKKDTQELDSADGGE